MPNWILIVCQKNRVEFRITRWIRNLLSVFCPFNPRLLPLLIQLLFTSRWVVTNVSSAFMYRVWLSIVLKAANNAKLNSSLLLKHERKVVYYFIINSVNLAGDVSTVRNDYACINFRFKLIFNRMFFIFNANISTKRILTLLITIRCR